MNFKQNKIRNHTRKKITISIPLIASVLLILFLTIGIIKTIKSIDFTVFLKIAGEELEQDDYGHTNFMLLGTGGENHDGGDLTDTIIVASLDHNQNYVTMISIPRDLYVKDDLIGSSRINEVFFNANKHFGSATKGLDYMKTKLEEIMGVPIHYWAKVDFSGFKDLVDALGGVDIDVKENIYDPFYPKDGTIEFAPFAISKGQHHLDGETALKYARSRKTTSDFDRAERQQKLIYSIKEKALQTNTLLNQSKISEILSALKNNIDTNIKVKEILTLGSFSKKFTQDQMSQRLIHDDFNNCGGFLYTPERQYYNGMFVLVPAGGFKFLHLYSDLNFSTPQIAHDDLSIQILNGTPTGGVAGETKQILDRFCFNITRFGNAETKTTEETTYYYKQELDEDGDPINKKPSALYFLQKIIPGKETTEIPEYYKNYMLDTNIILELGSDYVNSQNYIRDPFYYLPPVKSTTTKDSSNEDK